jgi:glycosyltransferase involved in cell wall biosynthesis
VSRPLRVLFVAHDAYRAGATIFLLNMLRWLREHTDITFDVAVREHGEMLAEFRKVCRSFVLAPAVPPDALRPRLEGWWRRWRPYERHRTLRSLATSGEYDLLYLNTLTLGDHLARIEGVGLPVVTHVHELGYVIRRFGHAEEQRVLLRSERVICVSDEVLQNLVLNFGCPSAKAQRIHGFTPVDADAQGTRQERAARLLDPLRIPRDALLVGVCAHGTLMKGVDLAVPLTRLLPPRVGGREVHLVWIGSERAEYPLDLAVSDARKAGVADRVHFAGFSREPASWLSLLDVHLMLSREESFPLAVMEAAVQGGPTIAFSDAGGAPEFILPDAGVCTPYLDLPAMAAAVIDLLVNEPARRAMGEVARRRVRASHAPDVVLPQVVRVMQDAVAAHGATGNAARHAVAH